MTEASEVAAVAHVFRRVASASAPARLGSLVFIPLPEP
jgi:hypothetical protein